MTAAIVDTGPLVAFFDRAEQHHRWVAERIEELDAPLLVCEPVLAEARCVNARIRRHCERKRRSNPRWLKDVSNPPYGRRSAIPR
jgi:predicted nucleic acid-binding protein